MTAPAAVDTVTVEIDRVFDATIDRIWQMFTDPADAPATTYSTIAAFGTIVVFEDKIEGDVSGWTITSDPSLTTGEWEQADPIFTLSGAQLAAPDDDADDGPGNVMAFVTENGVPGGAAGTADVDGGPTDLISPPIDLTETDANVRRSRFREPAQSATALSRGEMSEAMIMATERETPHRKSPPPPPPATICLK